MSDLRGIRAFPDVWIDNLNEFYPNLMALTSGRIDLDAFDKHIENQCRSHLRVSSHDEAWVDVGGAAEALAKAPCDVLLNTPLYSKALPDSPIYIILDVRRADGDVGNRGIKYRATYSFWCEENGAGSGLLPLSEVPRIENLDELLELAEGVFQVMRDPVRRSLWKQFALDAELQEVRIEPAPHPVSLPVVWADKHNVRIDCQELLNRHTAPELNRRVSGEIFSEANLKALADLAQPEAVPFGWRYLCRRDGGERYHWDGEYKGLSYYLKNLMGWLFKSAKSGDETLIQYDGKLCFCTGLQGRSGFYIYGICSDLGTDGRYHAVEWVENNYKGPEGRSPKLPPFAENRNNGLPFPADWTRYPGKLVCRYKGIGLLEARTNFKHIFHDHQERLPKAYFDVDPESGWATLNQEYAKADICDAIYKARKKIQGNYRYAVPGLYRNQITLMLPLCLAGSEYPNGYLVLIEDAREKYWKQGERFYRAPTILTPEMAYYSSRVIAPHERSAWERSFFDGVRKNCGDLSSDSEQGAEAECGEVGAPSDEGIQVLRAQCEELKQAVEDVDAKRAAAEMARDTLQAQLDRILSRSFFDRLKAVFKGP